MNWTSIVLNELNKAKEAYRIVKPPSLPEFAKSEFKIPREVSGPSEGRVDWYTYQLGVLSLMDNEDVEVLVWRKPARFGYTTMLCCLLSHYAINMRQSAALWLPTDSSRDEFVKDSINPTIRDIPALRSVMIDGGKKSSTDTIRKKQWKGGSVWHLLGGKSSKSYQAITVNLGIADEFSRFDQNIQGEGAPEQLMWVRLTQAAYPKLVLGSSPTLEENCNITQSLRNCPMVLQFAMKCPECQSFLCPEWGDENTVHGVKWPAEGSNEERAKSAHYVCQHCRSELDYPKIMDACDEGRWQTVDGAVWLENHETLRDENGPIEVPRRLGLDSNSLISPFISLEELTREYLSAIESAKRGDHTQIHAFENTRMGLPSSVKELSVIRHREIKKRAEDYDAHLPEDVQLITTFTDVQKDRLETLIAGWNSEETMYCLEYLRIYGDTSMNPNNSDPTSPWTKWRTLVQTSFEKESGTLLEASMHGVDSGYQTENVYDLSKSIDISRVIPTKGVDGQAKPIVTVPRRRNAKNVFLAQIGNYNAKDLLFARLEAVQSGKDNAIRFPLGRGFDEDFYRMLSSEKKVSKKRGSRMWHGYEQIGDRPNEAIDCLVGNIAMLRMLYGWGYTFPDQESTEKPEKKERKKRRGSRLNA